MAEQSGAERHILGVLHGNGRGGPQPIGDPPTAQVLHGPNAGGLRPCSRIEGGARLDHQYLDFAATQLDGGRQTTGAAADISTTRTPSTSVRALARHPDWVVRPPNPLPPQMCRILWFVGLTGGVVVVLIGLVASIWVHSLAVASVQFVGVAAAGAAFSVLGRRALSRERGGDLHATDVVPPMSTRD